MNTALLIINIGVTLIMLDQIRNIRKLYQEQKAADAARIAELESQLSESSEVQTELNSFEAELTPAPKTDA